MRTPDVPSPYHLLQEEVTSPPTEMEMDDDEFFRETWQIFVVCILLNQAKGTQVRKVLWRFLDEFDCASCSALEDGDLPRLAKILRPLGLQNRRAATIVAMSKGLMGFRGEHIRLYARRFWDLPGIGRYARASWEIFVGRKMPDRESDDPEDKELRRYLRWARRNFQPLEGQR